MKLTKTTLKRIIREELQKSRKTLKEGTIGDFMAGRMPSQPENLSDPHAAPPMPPPLENIKWLLDQDLDVDEPVPGSPFMHLVIPQDEMQGIKWPDFASRWKTHYDRETQMYFVATDVDHDEFLNYA